MKKTFLFYLAAFSLIIFSCAPSNPFERDVSEIDLQVKIRRLDVDFFNFSPENAETHIIQLKKDYGSFLDIYTGNILKIGISTDSLFDQQLGRFAAYCEKERIQDSVLNKYPNSDMLQSKLTSAFKYWKFYFESDTLPQIITCISAFNESIIASDSAIGIALDKYLGAKSEFYARLEMDNYLRKRTAPNMIPVDVVRAMIQQKYPFTASSGTLLERMIYEGKVQYLLNCILPETADTLKWSCSQNQFDWANRHEEKIWNYLVEQKKLYSTDNADIRNFVNDGPFTVPFSKVSIPRAGVWIGYKITERYMNNNDSDDLDNLMQQTDPNIILTKSKYNP